jgi:hypothetical protein
VSRGSRDDGLIRWQWSMRCCGCVRHVRHALG